MNQNGRVALNFAVVVIVVSMFSSIVEASAAKPHTVPASNAACVKMAPVGDDITLQIGEWALLALMTPLPEASSDLAALERKMQRTATRYLKMSKYKKNKRLIRSYIRVLKGLESKSDDEKNIEAIPLSDQMRDIHNQVAENSIRGRC